MPSPIATPHKGIPNDLRANVHPAIPKNSAIVAVSDRASKFLEFTEFLQKAR